MPVSAMMKLTQSEGMRLLCDWPPPMLLRPPEAPAAIAVTAQVAAAPQPAAPEAPARLAAALSLIHI